MEQLKTDPDLQVKAPDLRAPGKTLYMRIMPQTHDNLKRKVSELIDSGTRIDITDPATLGQKSKKITLNFVE